MNHWFARILSELSRIDGPDSGTRVVSLAASITGITQWKPSAVASRGVNIDAIMAPMPTTFMAQDEGFRKLAVGGDYYRTVNGGLATTGALISE